MRWKDRISQNKLIYVVKLFVFFCLILQQRGKPSSNLTKKRGKETFK